MMGRVLVVDDDKGLRALLGAVLEAYEVPHAEVDNGMDAIAMVNKFPDIAILILDLMMPGVDGTSVLRTLRASGSKAKVLILSAKTSAGVAESCLDAGADAFFGKPFKQHDLVRTLGHWLDEFNFAHRND